MEHVGTERASAEAESGRSPDLAALFHELRPRVRAFLAQHANADSDEIDDLEQEVWVRVNDSLARNTPQRQMISWVLGICRHVLIDDIRRRQRMRRLVGAAEPTLLEEGVPAPGTSAAGIAEGDPQTFDQVVNAIVALPPRERAVAIAAFDVGLAPREIARAYGLTSGSVRKALSVARRKLQRELAQLNQAARAEPGRSAQGWIDGSRPPCVETSSLGEGRLR